MCIKSELVLFFGENIKTSDITLQSMMNTIVHTLSQQVFRGRGENGLVKMIPMNTPTLQVLFQVAVYLIWSVDEASPGLS